MPLSGCQWSEGNVFAIGPLGYEVRSQKPEVRRSLAAVLLGTHGFHSWSWFLTFLCALCVSVAFLIGKIKRAGDAASPGLACLKFVPPAFLSLALPLTSPRYDALINLPMEQR